MATLIFDTHSFVKRLTAAGMPVAQAEVLAEEQARLIDDRLATKGDLSHLETNLRADMTQLRADSMVMKWMLGVIVAGIAGLVAKAFF